MAMQIENGKVVKRNEQHPALVAVLISPEYGAGWSTWNRAYPEMLFDPVIVDILLEGDNGYLDDDSDIDPKTERIRAYAENQYPDAYLGGAWDLVVEWVELGTEFIVHEYDGSETLMRKNTDFQWFTA